MTDLDVEDMTPEDVEAESVLDFDEETLVTGDVTGVVFALDEDTLVALDEDGDLVVVVTIAWIGDDNPGIVTLLVAEELDTVDVDLGVVIT